MQLSPEGFILAVVLVTAVASTVAVATRARRVSSGYETFYDAALETRQYLSGELFREQQDLVVVGNTGRFPTVVRFSNAMEAPTLNVRVEIPTPLSLWVAPRREGHERTQFEISSGDPQFDARFTIQTDNRRYARVLLAGDLLSALKNLCFSRAHYFAIHRGHMEFGEQYLAGPFVAQSVRRALVVLRCLTEVLESLPETAARPITPWKKNRQILVRGAIAAGVLAIVILFPSMRLGERAHQRPGPAAPAALAIPAGDASLIPDARGYRLATPADFDRDNSSWARGQGGTVGPVFSTQVGAAAVATGRVYVLVGKDGAKRVVVISEGRKIYDAVYANIAVVVKVRAQSLQGVEWQGRNVPQLAGDGLLLVQHATDPASGVVVFFREGKAYAAAPSNYRSIPLG